MRAPYSIAIVATAFMNLSSIAALADGPEPIATTSDLGRLQGRWIASAGAQKEIKVVLAVRGRQVEAAINTPQGIRLQLQGELKLDEKSSPRKLDWVNFHGADEQEFPQMPGIYKLDGDTFTVCNGGMNGARPREFKSGDGVLCEVVVFRRETAPSVARAKSSSKAH
jgi:uncharacterized protein (TIGR03067 family)